MGRRKMETWRPSFFEGTFWENFLFDRAINVFKYEGLPESINTSYLEAVKQRNGFCVWFKDKENNLRATEAAVSGYDCYGWPTDFLVTNPVLGTIQGKLGVDGVLDLNTRFAMSSIPLITKYADVLTEIDMDISVNLFNTKTARIWPVKNEGQAQQIRHMLDTMSETKVPAYVVSQSMRDSIENSKPIVTPVQFLGKDLQEAKLLTINEFYAQYGINGTPVVKRQRLNVNEVESNDEQISVNALTWMTTRQETMENLEKVFGISGATCSLNRDFVEQDMEALTDERFSKSVGM